jgi:putative SOS response-associated peptidase YedK
MCGRFTETAAFDVLAERFGITGEAGPAEELTARYNVSPSQEVPIVVATSGGRRLVMAKWGFRPAWIKSGSLAPKQLPRAGSSPRLSGRGAASFQPRDSTSGSLCQGRSASNRTTSD